MRPGSGADAVDVAVVEVVQADGEPFLAPLAEYELQDLGEVVEVLAGVEQVHDLRGFRVGCGSVCRAGAYVRLGFASWCFAR
jgi:hypothetical protein